jgi:hypothetical protein
MYLSAYHFDGNPVELGAACQRLLSDYPPDALLFHVLAVGEAGVCVLDACPDRATHQQFVANPEFRGALARARLPLPRIEVLGEVRHAYAQPSAIAVAGSTVGT